MLGNLTEIPASNTQKKMFYIELLLFLLFSESTFQKSQYKCKSRKKIITYYKRRLSRKQKAKFHLLNVSKGWPY